MRSEGKFYDDKNFPRGFNRSGFFTISEATLLSNYGRTMKGLTDGTLEAANEPERQFLAEVRGQLSVQSDFAKCWLKYTNKTTQKVRSYTLCVSQRAQASRYDDDSDIDSEGNIENDLDY